MLRNRYFAMPVMVGKIMFKKLIIGLQCFAHSHHRILDLVAPNNLITATECRK